MFLGWIGQAPNSYIPYLARGNYYENMGWYNRGRKFSADTSESQIRKLRLYHTKAQEDIIKAITLKSNLTLLPASLINIGMGLNDQQLKLKGLKDGLKINPASYEIRAKFLFSLFPRWGGSYEEMADFLADTKKHESKNKNLKPLAGFVYFAMGMTAKDSKEYEIGIELLTKAISYGDNVWYYHERGLCYCLPMGGLNPPSFSWLLLASPVY